MRHSYRPPLSLPDALPIFAAQSRDRHLPPSHDKPARRYRLRMPADRACEQGAVMRLRSLLFVPGDRPERMEKALGLGADALILDLEDSVAPTKKADARDAVRAFLARPDRPIPLFVRINQIGRPSCRETWCQYV